MKRRIHRKTAPGVLNGRVRAISDGRFTPNYYTAPGDRLVIDRERPGPGYRHYLRPRDIQAFLDLLPDWETLSQGLHAVVLAREDPGIDGWHYPGVVALCAQPCDPWIDYGREYFEEHRGLFTRLGVTFQAYRHGCVVHFSPAALRAYQLCHVLLHELGHHHDRMTTRSKEDAARGEAYAEQYALRHEALIWERYQDVFGPVAPTQ